MAKLLITHPRLGFGGSEATVLQAIQGLKEEHEVTLLTQGAAELRELNDFAGTSLRATDFELRVVPPPFPLDRVDRFARLRGAFFQRQCRAMAGAHDLCISGYNPIPFGAPALQLVADFSFDAELRQCVTAERRGVERLWTSGTLAQRAYRRIADMAAPEDKFGWRDDRILANSRWTQRQLERRFGVEAEVVYPPVPSRELTSSEVHRKDAFIALGRVVREKRTHLAVEILEAVRERGYNIELTIVGPEGEPGYGSELRELVKTRDDWVRWTGRVTSSDKKKLLSEHRYAISTRLHEPFGIAVAEMLEAGCVPFVPSEGGQVEIVGDPHLAYDSPEDAVEKICTILSEDGRRSGIRKRLEGRRGRFSPERFQAELLTIVAEALAESERP